MAALVPLLVLNLANTILLLPSLKLCSQAVFTDYCNSSHFSEINLVPPPPPPPPPHLACYSSSCRKLDLFGVAGYEY